MEGLNTISGTYYPSTEGSYSSVHDGFAYHEQNFSFIQENLNLEYLGLSFAGGSTAHQMPDETILRKLEDTTLANMLKIRKFGRLAIEFATETHLLKTSATNLTIPQVRSVHCHLHSDGSECFARDANEDILSFEMNPFNVDWAKLSGCDLAQESLRAAAIARLLRHHTLENGDLKGYRHIKVVMGVKKSVSYIHMRTDDDKTG